MKSVLDLNLGFLDASEYDRRKNKDFFEKIFIVDDVARRVVQSNIYFLIGEKGTGKSAYAVFLHNHDFENTRTFLVCPDSDSYIKLLRTCHKNGLESTEFKHLWKSLIYLLCLRTIREHINVGSMKQAHIDRYDGLMGIIDQLFQNKFKEDINLATKIIDNIDFIIKDLIQIHGNIIPDESINNLLLVKILLLQDECEEILRSLKLKKSFILFVDSYDIRPENTTEMTYEIFISCMKGLCTSVLEINRFLADLRGLEDKYIKVMLSLRPDVLIRMDIQNLNERIQDNSVILNWNTSYRDYRGSRIFKLVDKLLSAQQEEANKLGETWDYYFPYKVFNSTKKVYEHSFISFLRYSWYRPRDIIKMMKIMKERADKNKLYYKQEDFENILYEYSDFLLGEVWDEISFYFGRKDRDTFLTFFQHMDCMCFSYKVYIECFIAYLSYLDENKISKPFFLDDPNVFLQFLYEHNIIGYDINYDGGKIRTQWFYRDLGPTNIRPNIRIGESVNYHVHHSISKALNIDFYKNIE